jgi:WD40-like Beta Propeller Repeat
MRLHHSRAVVNSRAIELICNMEGRLKMFPIDRISMLAMISCFLMCAPFSVRAADAPDARPTFGVFSNPEPVTIEGYSQDAMEPFISPDGNYLFFNNSNAPTVDTNLYYATRIDDVTFQYQGEVGGVNSTALDAVASMDSNGTFFFVSTRNYAMPLFATIYWGTFSGGSVTGVAVVPGISKQKAGDVNFDQCISPDGGTLYFVDGVFNGGSVPEHASIAIAKRNGDHFARLKNSAEIMRKINTHDLNYAPDVSKSGLEFFFTRIPKQGSQPKPPPVIYTATRASISKPFGKPRKIEAITGFAEAPALSPDEKSLYYHLQVNGTFVIYRVTRP